MGAGTQGGRGAGVPVGASASGKLLDPEPSFPFRWQGFYTRAQLLRWYGAIPLRTSCRRFVHAADVSQRSALEYAAARVCLPGVRIFPGGPGRTRPAARLFSRNRGPFSLVAVVADAKEPGALLHAGISGEAWVLEAAALGLATCWLSPLLRRRRCPVPLKSGETLAALIAYGIPDPDRVRANRKRRALASLCLGDPAAWPYWAFRAAEAVRMAPSAFNRQPWRFSFSGGTLRIALRPSGGIEEGIAVLHAECALAEQPRLWRRSRDRKGMLVGMKSPDVPV